jgi:quinoprotein glucose dehydrogenase
MARASEGDDVIPRHTRKWLLALFIALLLRGDVESESSSAPVIQPEIVYGQHCASCHGQTLRGSEAGPALTGETFSNKWGQQSEQELLDRIRTTMPPSAPGSLRAAEYKALAIWLRTGNHNQSVAEAPTPPKSGGVTTEWLFNRGDAGSTGYSPLDLINKDNVSKLRIAWRWKTDNFGPGLESNLEATPLMADGILYTTAGLRRDVVAIDARTGETLWMYRIDEGERGRNAPRNNSGRGVSYVRSSGSAIIYCVTPGFQLIALDAKTGTPINSFGQRGIVDLKLQLDEAVDTITSPIGSSSPPLVMDGVVVVGPALSSGGAPASMKNVKGSVLAFDARTGKRLWIFHTIPLAGNYGSDTWKEGSAAYTGNTGVWTVLSGDPQRGYVFLPVEAATSDFYGGHRLGNDLFSQSLVCLDIKTGRRVWHYQLVHHDIWDYDPPAAPVLFDLHTNAGTIPLVAQVTKQAYTFVFNRETGEPIWPINERPVPPSTVPGEVTSETQPFPTKPPAFDRQGFSDSDLIDLTPEISEEAKRIAKNYTFGPLYMPQTLLTATNKGTMQSPGSLGGANWQGAVVDPESGVLYVSSMTSPSAVGLVHDPALSDMRYVVPAYARVPGPFGLPLVRPPWGRITAIDLNTGDLLWQVANADTPSEVRDHPKLQGITLPRTGIPERSGLLVTRSLLFAGEGSGLFTMDGKGGRMFRALDKKTGDIIYEFALPARQSGVPMTYAIDGKQYIVVAVGEKDHAGEFVALSLP